MERNALMKQVAHRWEEHDLVFPSNVGTPISRWRVTDEFVELIGIAGVPKMTFHELRHTSITLTLNHGGELWQTAKRVGHSDIHQTADRYGHLLENGQDEIARLIEELIDPVEIEL